MSLNGDLEVLQHVVDGALASLEASRERIDDLNVYPVPDGDTGTNLTLTVRALSRRGRRSTPPRPRGARTRGRRAARSWARAATRA